MQAKVTCRDNLRIKRVLILLKIEKQIARGVFLRLFSAFNDLKGHFFCFSCPNGARSAQGVVRKTKFNRGDSITHGRS